MIDRFKLLLEQLHLSPSEFADKIGIQRSSVSHVLSGRNKPSIDFLEKILIIFPDIDTTWLITGRINSQKDVKNGNSDIANDLAHLQNADLMIEENMKSTVPANEAEPVEQIIIVYKNDTFRMLKPAGK
jgi:transcriptional regulator with XRE-family HTH domain